RYIPPFIDVGAVDREAGDGFTDGVAQHAAGEVTGAAVVHGDAVQQVAEHVDFARQRLVHHQLLTFVHDAFGTHRSAGEALVKVGEVPLVSAVDQHPIDEVGKVVADRAIQRPLGQ